MPEQKYINRKRKAIRDGNKNLLASTCIDLAELYVNEGRYDEAIDEYVTVADVYKEMGKRLDYARANRMIGEAYTHLREYDNALRYQQIHLNVAREEHDNLEEQRALATIGHTHLTRYLDNVDNPDKTLLNLAYKSFMRSLMVCERLTGINKREHKDMIARLLANLGVVEECRGNYEKGIELVEKSISICKSYELFEQLERGYTFLGSLYVRKQDYHKAINQYNLAIEVAERLKDKIPLMCASLCAKADILIKLSDFQAAKGVLLKAHKLKHPSSNERENIEQNLKTVAAMCNAECSLLTIGDLDCKSKKRNYEKLGDGACSLKHYSAAIKYYQKMLEAAINNGESGRKLSPCYISLAETYHDDKQFDSAIEYFKKDYGISSPNTKDSVTTLLNIVDCMEAAQKDIAEIETIYEQARNECIAAGLKRLEAKVISRYVGMLKRKERSSQAAQLEIELGKMDFAGCEMDSEPSSQEQATPNIGDDISIGEITDLSDGSDTESNTTKRRTTRKRTKGLVIKKNTKGETQLHIACINGNMELVKRLLNQGHTVNIRDNCGWLPIHEACICGHVEIVEMLIEKGASINDRGGKHCNGMTPLHDAATNGHLEVIQLLLNKGASPIAKNDMGEMPLHILQKWRTSADLDAAAEVLYNSIIDQLSQAVEKSGHSNDVVIREEKNTALVMEHAEPNTRTLRRKTIDDKTKSPAKSIDKPKLGALRRNVSSDDNLDASSSKIIVNLIPESSVEELSAKNEYKRVMENLRHPLREENVEKKRKSNENSRRSAYLTPDEVDDDWLIDDLANQQKKRKTGPSDSLFNTLGTRRISSGSLGRNSTSSSLKSRTADDFDIPNEFLNEDFYVNDAQTGEEYEAPVEIISDGESDRGSVYTRVSPVKKRKLQSSLIDQGFIRHLSSSPTNLSIGSNTFTSERKHQTKLTHFGHTRSPEKFNRENYIHDSQFSNYNTFNTEGLLSVDVRIDGKLYKVGVRPSEIHIRNIKWLADKAAKLYSRKEFLKVTLELETKNGAILAEDDFISILFSAGSTQAEQVEARVSKWILPPLFDRYKETCSVTNVELNEDLAKILQESSTSLDISDMCLGEKILAPFFSAINRQTNLHRLNLRGNFMLDESMQLLCSSLPSLHNLAVLDLSLNQLTSESLEFLANMFKQSNASILQNLISLDFSFNPLGNEAFKHLALIMRYLKLQTLSLISVDFTYEIFNVSSNRNTDLYLDYVVNFDVSYNRLNKQEIMLFLYWLKPQQIEKLNISSNGNQMEGLAADLANWFKGVDCEKLNLRSLNLSRCNVQDHDVFELLRALRANNCASLNLSYNEHLTTVTLQRLLQHYPPFVHLDLSGCENILDNFESSMINAGNFSTFKMIRFSHHTNECIPQRNLLVDTWKSEHKERAKINDCLRGFLELSIFE